MKNNKLIKVLVVLGAIVLFLYGFIWYQNNHIVITDYEYKNEKITKGLEGYRIVQISDLHNAEFGLQNGKLLRKIEAKEPDIIVITGDIVDSSHTDVAVAVDFVEQASKICDVYYVTGNHEYWLDENTRNKLFEGLEEAGARILDNQKVSIKSGKSKFTLIGLDDNSLSYNTLKNIMSDCSKKRLSVVLAHEPQYIENYSKSEADLILSGHAHGGQFILPFVGPLVAPDQGFYPEYTSGEHKLDETTMIVSRGLGNSIIPVRLFNYPEIVCVELKCE